MRYRLIDQHRVPSRRLWRLKSPIAALFLLERRLAPEEVHRAKALLVESLAAPEDAELRRAFLIWARHAVPGGDDVDERPIPALPGLEELESMFEDNLRRLGKQYRNEGRREGEVDVLLRLLERKFGPLSETTRTRVQRASSARRMVWADRILTAATLAEVFAAERRAS